MDFDGDGKRDVVTGTYLGPIQLFRGEGNGQYAPAEPLKDQAGNIVQIDSATVVSAYDWDKDGKPDLIVGTISGAVWFLRNLGGGAVAPAAQLDVAEAIDGGPAACDWDCDGVMDLFLGSENGAIQYYHGKKGGTAPQFEAPVEVVPPLNNLQTLPMPAAPGETLDWPLRRPMMRAKPSVGDWNGDGKLDLLVGDYCLLEGKPQALPPEKQAEFEALRKEQRELQAKSEQVAARIKAATYESLGLKLGSKLDAEQQAKVNGTYDRLYGADPEALATDKRLAEVFEKLQPMMPPIDFHGFVWVFLRK